jgi:hypothetical protein
MLYIYPAYTAYPVTVGWFTQDKLVIPLRLGSNGKGCCTQPEYVIYPVSVGWFTLDKLVVPSRQESNIIITISSFAIWRSQLWLNTGK